MKLVTFMPRSAAAFSTLDLSGSGWRMVILLHRIVLTAIPLTSHCIVPYRFQVARRNHAKERSSARIEAKPGVGSCARALHWMNPTGVRRAPPEGA